MLNGTAAADAEMLAERFDALGARLLDPDQLAPIRMMALYGRDIDHLAAERVGDKNALPLDKRDAVAEMADMIDGEPLNHGARR